MSANRAEIIEILQGDILRLQGFKPCTRTQEMGLGAVNNAFPNHAFPLGAVHEFITATTHETAPTCGFISGLLSTILGDNGVAIWISTSRTLFPPSLKTFGLDPDRIIFLDLEKEKDVLWAMEEALKCPAVAAVVGEMDNISFTDSRRLQLAVEQSSVTGFIIRRNCRGSPVGRLATPGTTWSDTSSIYPVRRRTIVDCPISFLVSMTAS